MIKNGIYIISGKRYYFDKDGCLHTGWIKTADGKYYHAAPDGVLNEGKTVIDRKEYYFENGGVMAVGFRTFNGKNYYYKTDGTKAVGWFQAKGESYYANADGVVLTGWIRIGKKYYYLGSSGKMVKNGAYTIGGKLYYFGTDGIMRTGWIKTADGKYYHAGTDGILNEGKRIIDGKEYYFDKGGIMAVGFRNINNVTYYYKTDGTKATGLITAGVKLYCFDENGAMYKDRLLTVSGNKYYANPDGTMFTGWKKINNNYKYFEANGKMAVSKTVNGRTFDSNGNIVASELLINNKKCAQDIFRQYGSTTDELYSYMRETNRFKRNETTKTLEQIEAIGWLYFADHAMTNYYNVCYYMSAKMDFLMREARYECRIVHSTHNTGDHYWNQVMENGKWTNYDCTNGLSRYTLEQMIAYGNSKFLGYVEPQYFYGVMKDE